MGALYAETLSFLSTWLYTWILPILLIGGGLYYTIKTGCIQIRMGAESVRSVMEPPESENSLSSFRALMVSTASRVGTGNIIGVSSAICVGGAGAVFWMWVVAFLGGATAFIESTLAQIYKKKDDEGGSYGGPAYYIEDGLKLPILGAIFAITLILTYMVGFNMLAGFNVNSAFTTYDFYNPNVTPKVMGTILAVGVALSIFGGSKHISTVTAILVPFMSVIYILVAIVVMIMHANLLPQVFATIFQEAFDFEAIFGGFAGSAIMLGLKRGLYSNEAGIGSAPNAAASADVSHPVKQGLVQMLSVFIDTILICTATAMMLLASGVAPDASLAGAPYNILALEASFGVYGRYFLTLAIFLFGFTTLIGNYFYAEANLKYLMGNKHKKGHLIAFRVLAVVIIFFGTWMQADVAWDTADVIMGIMAIINIPAIFFLRKYAVDALNDYTKQKKAGKNPVFKAKNINLPDNVDFWQ